MTRRASRWMAVRAVLATATTAIISASGPGACKDTYGSAEAPLIDGGSNSEASTGDGAINESLDASIESDAANESDDAAIDSASADAEADADTGAPLGCNGKLDCDRVVFVTSDSFTGDLGGLAGADAKCKLAADKSTRPRIAGRKFLAWVSTTPTLAVVERFPHGIGKYILVNDFVLALDWGDLLDGSIAGPINRDEMGNAVDDQFVWTGTTPAGALAPNDCNGFASTAPNGARGSTVAAAAGWTNVAQSGNCNATHHLYCFEY